MTARGGALKADKPSPKGRDPFKAYGRLYLYGCDPVLGTGPPRQEKRASQINLPTTLK